MRAYVFLLLYTTWIHTYIYRYLRIYVIGSGVHCYRKQQRWRRTSRNKGTPPTSWHAGAKNCTYPRTRPVICDAGWDAVAFAVKSSSSSAVAAAAAADGQCNNKQLLSQVKVHNGARLSVHLTLFCRPPPVYSTRVQWRQRAVHAAMIIIIIIIPIALGLWPYDVL